MAHVKVNVQYSKDQFEEFDPAYEEGFAFALESILDEKFENENHHIGINYFPCAPGDRFEITTENHSLIDEVRKEITRVTKLYVDR